MLRFKAVALLCVFVLMVLAIVVPMVNAGAAEPIYRPGDWIRYRYIIKTSNETCVWIIRVTIREVNATHVRYDAGLESMVSGGKLCEGFTTLLVMGLGFESATPVDLRTTTPESKRLLISSNYTGTYTFGNATFKYYRGVLVWYYEKITTPFVGAAEADIIDTSISDLKQFITVTISTPPQTPATAPATITVTATTTLTQIITTTIPTTITLTTTTRIYETITETIVKHETVTTTSIATVTTEKTVEKTATLTVTTPTTVYEKVVDWGTTIPIAIILLVIGIAIGYLIKRK